MADKKRGKRRKDDYVPGLTEDQVEKPPKEEFAVAKWLRKNVSVKRTKFLNHNVEYFTGAKAVDALLESPWAKPTSENEESLFTSRRDVSDFLDRMLRHKFFHRAKKVPVSEQELKLKQKKKEKKDKDDKKDKETDVKKRKEEETAESSHAEGGKESESGKAQTQDERKKKKHKIRLEMHLDQYFVDGLDAYVWIYDPIPVYYWLCGFLLVLGAIAICMFPLWPPTVRMGVYYGSVATAGFLMLIIALAVLRLIIFCLVWLLTLGAHHLWLFPNLTEDVGFFASFWPLYQYEYKGKGSTSSTKSSKKKKKDKDSDNEDNEDDPDESKSKSKKGDGDKNKSDDDDVNDDDDVGETDDKSYKNKEVKDKEASNSETKGRSDQKSSGDGDEDRGSETETESEGSSQQSQTGKDFEMVDKADLQES